MAQEEMRKRKQSSTYSSSANCFAGKIVCGECGGFYGSKVWHSTSMYRRTIWKCNHKFQNEHKCSTPHLYEENIKRAFVGAFNSLITNKDEILHEYNVILDTFMDTRTLDAQIKKLLAEQADITAAIQQLVLTYSTFHPAASLLKII